jgi:hypothetical protein
MTTSTPGGEGGDLPGLAGQSRLGEDVVGR